jgi:hypothetical protein
VLHLRHHLLQHGGIHAHAREALELFGVKACASTTEQVPQQFLEVVFGAVGSLVSHIRRLSAGGYRRVLR